MLSVPFYLLCYHLMYCMYADLRNSDMDAAGDDRGASV